VENRPAVAIVHDAQLSEEPELLQAAGSVAALALENAELDAAWKDSLGDRERVKLERDLHDGAQQRLIAVQVKPRMAQDHANCRSASTQTRDVLGIASGRRSNRNSQATHTRPSSDAFPRLIPPLGLATLVVAR
jgi:hypothetical protein